MQLKEKILNINNFSYLDLGVLTITTIIFFVYENLLAEGWYYIPERATIIASILCVLWQITLIVGIYIFLNKLKNRLKRISKIMIVVIGVVAVFILTYSLFSYHLQYDEKIEQYDKHIALYVNNTFVRVNYREPFYRYEENWLLMRRLSSDELNEAIKKYGSPDDYYK